MTLIALTHQADIAQAYKRLCDRFERDCEVLERTVGYKSGSELATVRWYPQFGFWARISAKTAADGYCCGFGVENPHNVTDLAFTCEINSAYSGVDKRRAGLFVRSDNGTIYLAHTGGVGGGRPGVGKARLLKYYGSETVDDVHWPDKTISEYIIIGALDDSDFMQRLAEFVQKIAAFKLSSAA